MFDKSNQYKRKDAFGEKTVRYGIFMQFFLPISLVLQYLFISLILQGRTCEY